MKRMVLVLLLCAAGMGVRAQERDSLLVMFWNVENFFDWKDQGTGESDNEFSSFGDRHWTKSRFYAKCDAIAKSVMWIGDRHGRLPDIIGLAEVENRGVLSRLLSYTLLRKYDYGIIHHDSQDRRGIDVAILYRKSVMDPVSVTVRTPEGISTRDILHSRMRLRDSSQIDFIVNHHPSKFGGEKESIQKRALVMGQMKSLVDSLLDCGNGSVAVMGDFNDTPDAVQFSAVTDILDNKGMALHERGEGTIRYKGKWELIDFFLTGHAVKSSGMEVVRIPFLMTYEKRYPGEKPLRTYSGPRYLGGVSDHCPVVLWIY